MDESSLIPTTLGAVDFRCQEKSAAALPDPLCGRNTRGWSGVRDVASAGVIAVSRLRDGDEPVHRGNVRFNHGGTNMGDKGSKDKGKREPQKKALLSPKEKRKLKKEKKNR
jgi:hypothetical protein